jgi:hypothetical protein
MIVHEIAFQTFISVRLEHGLRKLDGLVGARPDDFGPALVKHSSAARFVVSAGSLVNSVERKLDRHLSKIRNILNDSKSFMKSVENYHLIGRSISTKNAAIRFCGVIIMMKKNE